MKKHQVSSDVLTIYTIRT